MTEASPPSPTVGRRGTRNLPAIALVVAFLACALAWVSPVAEAAPPSRLQTQLTDSAGVLSANETSQVSDRIAQLRSTDNIRLWVTYVDTLDGIPVRDWATSTGRMSDLGDRDALLVVAVRDRSYWFQYGDPSTSQRITDRISTDDIEPRLAVDDWAGAAIGAADGLERQGSGSEVSGTTMLLVIGGIIVAVAAVIVVSRRRGAKRTAQVAREAEDIAGDDTARLASLPLEALDLRARRGLEEADRAVESSGVALTTAVSEFGELRTRPFTAALGTARAEVTAAHGIVQQLDDEIPESPDQRRAMLLDVAARSERAERTLEAQAGAFAEMRDLLINGGAAVDGLTQRAVSLRARLPEAERTMADLRQRFPAESLASIAENLPLAGHLLDAAEAEITRARAALSRPVGQQAEAVDAMTSAEDEVGHAEKLVDAVAHAADNIAAARTDLGALISEVEQELVVAGTLLASADVTGPTARGLDSAASAARKSLETARRNGDSDPLGSFSGLIEVDVDLDRALAAAGHEAEAAGRARAARQASITRARAAVREADDFINSRSYVIGQSARTRLASARDALTTAETIEGPAAIVPADRALALAQDALRQARTDASRPQYSNRPPGPRGRGGSNTGAVVGGMVAGALIQGMSRGGGPGRSRGGFGGGGGFSGGGGWGGGSGGRF